MIKFSVEICHVSGLNPNYSGSRSRAYFSKYLCVPSKNSQMFFVICSFYQVPTRLEDIQADDFRALMKFMFRHWAT